MKYNLVALVFFVVGCHSSYAREISFPLRSMPLKVNVLDMKSVASSRIASLVSSQLIEVTDNFEFVPSLASKYWWEDNGKTLYIKIAKEKFSDGSDIKISDVISSLKRCIFASKKTLTSMFQYLKGYNEFLDGGGSKMLGVSSVKENIIKLSFVKKTPLILENLSHSSCSILKDNGSSDLLAGAVSSGAYTIVSSDKKMIRLKRNKLFHVKHEIPTLINIVANKSFGDVENTKRWSSIIISKNTHKELNDHFNRYDYSFLGAWQISFNNSRNKLKNKITRKAITLAIDKRKLASKLNWDKTKIQSSIIPFGMRGFQKDTFLNFDPRLATELLTKLGFTKKKPLILKLLVKKRNDGSESVDVWNKAFPIENLKIILNVKSGEEYEVSKRKYDFDLLFHGKAPGSMEPQILLNTFSSSSIYNTANIKSNKCDKLIEVSSNSLNTDERYLKYKMAEKCLLGKYFVIPLASISKRNLYIRKPWVLSRQNQFLLYPFKVYEWRLSNE